MIILTTPSHGRSHLLRDGGGPPGPACGKDNVEHAWQITLDTDWEGLPDYRRCKNCGRLAKRKRQRQEEEAERDQVDVPRRHRDGGDDEEDRGDDQQQEMDAEYH